MKISIDHKTSIASGSFGAAAAGISLSLEGRKQWLAHNQLRFETSAHNIAQIQERFPESVLEDRRGVSAFDEGKGPSHAEEPPLAFRMAPMAFQRENFDRFKRLPAWAMFSDAGTGKTKVCFDIISYRYLIGTVTGVIVLSSPKGVHAQWIEEQLPKHLWSDVPVLAHIWDGRKLPAWIGTQTMELQIFSGNIDMLKGRGFEALQIFANQHRAKLMVLVDESDSIKNLASVRSKRLRQLASVTRQRGIMTGTPIAKDLTDEWAQFYFLDPAIIGHKYLTSFRAQYCVMGGFEGRVVVGHKNVEQFKRLTAPFVFRATKAELKLPEKIYDSVVFDLTDEQKRMIKDLKEKFFTEVSSGAASAQNGAVALLRMQQIANGFSVGENGETLITTDNPRLSALLDLRRQVSGKVIIWCRFRHDVAIVRKQYASAVTIYGANTPAEREAAKAAFTQGDAHELIATAGAAGKGIDGLQKVCDTAIYYSNSYNAIDRWQSEDRIHRIGMKGTATYFDLIGRGSPDRAILANLRRKRDIASLALDDIMEIMESVK